jgi:hypothetical protein
MTSELRLRVARARAEGRLTSAHDSREREADRCASSYAAAGRELATARIHTDPEAASLAAGLGTRAFSLGRDVVFGAGEYQPGTAYGRRLLGHELVHVEQARRGGAEVIARNPPDDDTSAQDAVDTGTETITLTDADAGVQPSGDAGVPVVATGDAGVQPSGDAGAVPSRSDAQAACVASLGGVAEYRSAGAGPSEDELRRYNEECARRTGYAGPAVEGSVEAYHEELRNFSILSPETFGAIEHFMTHGGGTTGTGLLMVGGGLLVVFGGPVGWLAGAGAALALAGGVATTTLGVTQWATSGSNTEQQNAEINHAAGAVGVLSTPAGLVTTSGALMCGANEQTAFRLGGYAALGEAGVNVLRSGYGVYAARREAQQAALEAGLEAEGQAVSSQAPANMSNASTPNASMPNASMPNASVPNASVPNAAVPPVVAPVPPVAASVPAAAGVSADVQAALARADAAAARSASAPAAASDALPAVVRTPGQFATGRLDWGRGQCTTSAAVITLRDLGAVRAQAVIAANANRANGFLRSLYGRFYRAGRGTLSQLEAQAARKPPGTLVAVSVRRGAAPPGEPQFNHMIVGRVQQDGTLTFRHTSFADVPIGQGLQRQSNVIPVAANDMRNFAVHQGQAGSYLAEMRWRFLTPTQQRAVVRSLGVTPNRSTYPINQ